MKSPLLNFSKLPFAGLSLLIALASRVDAQTTFQFSDGSALDNKAVEALPYPMVAGGITLRALSIFGPTSFEDFPGGVEQAKATQTSFNGLGIDSFSIANAELAGLYGDDVGSESNSLNILESVTVDFDHSVLITALRFRDLENFEKVTVRTGSGVEAVLEGSATWSVGAGSFDSFTGSQLGALEGFLLQRGETLTLEFDTVDPLDRVPDGNGNLLSASPSCNWNSITVEVPQAFGLGTPYAVQGSATEATVGGELWGGSADVTLLWTTDPGSGWPNSRSLGTQSGVLFEGLMDLLTPDTVWYYKFVADNGVETIESPIAQFIWGTQFFVSPAGDDANDGLSESSPMKTIQGAIDRIHNMQRSPQPEGPVMPNYLVSATSTYGDSLDAHIANLVDPVTVVLLPGWHFLDETIQIDKVLDGNIHFVGQWSSTAMAVLEDLLAVHGDDPDWFDLPADLMPVVSGGVVLDDWTTATVNGRTMWFTDLPAVAAGDWEFKQLFVDGMRAQRSRWPKEGWFRMAEVDNETRLDFRVDDSDLQGINITGWPDLQNVEVVMLHRWVEDRNKILSFNPSTNWISLSPPRPDYDLFGSHPAHEAGFAAYYFDNVFETLSEPGEFYLNRESGRLYYVPMPGQTPENTQVIAPKLKQLVSLAGKPANDGASLQNVRLWNVTFSNLAFMHTLSGLLTDHIGTGNGATNSANAAIQYVYSRKGAITGCFFGHLGEYAIELGPETTGFDINSNFFRSLAAGALKSWQVVSPQNFEQRTGFIAIQDNDILGHALFWHGAPALLCTQNIFMSIEHNHIREGSFNGINISGVESNILRYGHSNHVRKNRIHDIGLGMLSDLAGIYAPGQNPHGIIEGNVVHDIVVRDYTSPAIYLDGTAEYWTVRYNWLSRSNTKLMNIKGWTHSVHDNVFAYSANKILDRRNGDLPSGQSSEFPLLTRSAPEFTRNIHVPLSAAAYSNEEYSDVISPWAVTDDNVFWNHGMEPWVFLPDLTLAQFQASDGQDLNSLVIDPGLIDPLRGDFRLGATPPAVTALGITSSDNRDAGVRPSFWAAAGMPPYIRIPALPAGWTPLDVPGLVGWLDSEVLGDAGPLSEWTNKLPFSYTMQQFDPAFQPEVVQDYINGQSVVAFDGSDWMGNDEFGLEARESIGQFRLRDFVVFAVYRSQGAGSVLLSKGDGGDNGGWSIGESPNAFQWNGANSIGDPVDGWAVRAWRRQGDMMEFFRNGLKIAEFSPGADEDFDTNNHLFLGKRQSLSAGMLDGEVGEILVYLGAPSPADFDLIHSYLMDKWTSSNPVFESASILEGSAAYGLAYQRSLATHLLAELDPSSLRFEKASGPDWLVVSPEGMLSGIPDPSDAGSNIFQIQAFSADGNVQVVTLEIPVAAPDSSHPAVPEDFRIEVVSGTVHLEWTPNTESDLSHYVISRSSNLEDGFVEWANPVWESNYSEPIGEASSVFYVIEAVDSSGNTSGDL